MNCDEAYYIASSDNDGDERTMDGSQSSDQPKQHEATKYFYEINYKKSLEKYTYELKKESKFHIY